MWPGGSGAPSKCLRGEPERRLSHGGDSQPEVDIPKLVRLYEAGKLRFDGLISKRYGLEQINEAIADMREGAEHPRHDRIPLGCADERLREVGAPPARRAGGLRT